MNSINDLLQLKERLDHVQSLLLEVDEHLQDDVEHIVTRAEAAQSSIIQACDKATSLNPFQRTSEREIQHLQSETTALEDLSQVVEESNTSFVAKRVDKEVTQLKSNIQTFLDSYQHFIDLYGFALISSKDHLVLAQSIEGEYITLPNNQRDKHIFILGNTGSGKSEAMNGFVLQDIFQGRNGVLLDPFGGLSHKIAAFVMAYEPLKADFIALKSQALKFLDTLLDGIHPNAKQACLESIEYEKLSIFADIFAEDINTIFPQLNVKVIDLSSKTKDNPYRINPFRPSNALSIQDSVQLLLDAIAMEMGSSLRETPQAAAILESLFAMIAANGGGFGDILPTLNTLRLYKGTGKGSNLLPADVLRQLQVSNEPMLNNAADYIEKQLLSFSGNNFSEQVNSSRNRLNVLNNSKLCHSLFLTSETTFDIADIVNSEDAVKPFVIMHIPCAESGGSIAATYIYKLIEKVLRERTEKQKKNRFYLYADEFHKFLGGSMHSASQMGDLFTAMRQYGMALTVAMQNSAQLKAQDPSGYVFASVVESCKTKMIFNCAGDDAKYFADNIFKNKGKMEEVSYSFSNGEARAFTINSTTGFSQGYNRSQSETDSVGTSTAKALGHSVSEGFNRSTNSSHTQSIGSSEGKTSGSSTGHGQSYKDGMKYQDITQKSNSMISCSQQFTQNQASSDTQGSSEGSSRSSTNSETNTTSHSTSHADSQSYGISENTSETIGLAKQLSHNSSCSKSIRRLTIAEETRLYAQQLNSLEQREVFISSCNNLKKAVSLDSLFIKMENQLEPYLDNYFEYLYSYQDIDRWEFKGKVTVEKAVEDSKPVANTVGVDGVF